MRSHLDSVVKGGERRRRYPLVLYHVESACSPPGSVLSSDRTPATNSSRSADAIALVYEETGGER